jgi:hypothetical protein
VNNEKDIRIKQAHQFLGLRRFQFRIILVRVIPIITAVFICVASGASALATPSEQQQQQQQQRDPSRINSRKSYSDESQQLEDLWVSTMKNSAELQEQIRKEYPTLADEKEAGLVDIVQDVNPVGQHEGFGNATSLTIPNLEPNYPEPGRNIPVYLLPQYARQPVFNDHGISGAIFMYRIAIGTDLKSRLKREAQSLFACYKKYCASLEFSTMTRSLKTPLSESASKACEDNRKKLVMIAGEKAVEQLDQQLGIR